MVKTDRRIIKTRKAIYQAFIELLREKCFESISMNDIAEKANINRGTLYLHFTDKIDLSNHVVKDFLKDLTDICVGRYNQGEEAQKAILVAYFQHFEDNYSFYSMLLGKQAAGCFRNQFLQVVIDQMSEVFTRQKNELRTDVEIRFKASAFVGVVEWWISNRMPLSIEEIVNQVWRLLQGDY